MKKIIKNNLLGFVLGIVLTSGIAVCASEIFASSIKYKDTNVESAIDELYTISSTYKNLSSSTTVDSSNLLSGVTAYNNNGQLITGNLSTNCISSSQVKPANSQLNIDFGFVPTKFVIYLNNTIANSFIEYEYNHITNKIYYYQIYPNQDPYFSEDTVISLNGTIASSNWSTSNPSGVYAANTTVYYMACH